MGDFNIHQKEHNDIIFNNDDIEKEKLINRFESSINLINTNNQKGIGKNRCKWNKDKIE